jgi:hypothetical protein
MQVPNTLEEAIQFFSDYNNCGEFMVSIRWEDIAGRRQSYAELTGKVGETTV